MFQITLCLSALFMSGVEAYKGELPSQFVLPLALNDHPYFQLGIQSPKIPTNWILAKNERTASTKYEKFFVQKLDQTNPTNTKTFNQRYFVNTQWKNNSSGAVHMLYVEGENIGNESKVIDETLPHVLLAKNLGATVWALEHRWRGKSQPLKRTFASNYRDFLFTGQAVEDVASFIQGMNKNSGESQPKWVIFGSGYGGIVALWFRLKYPSLSLGVVSDSANAVPIADFYTHQRFVEQAYSNYSYECWHGIKMAALAIRNELQYPNGMDRLNNELKLTPILNELTMDYKNMQYLHQNLLQLFILPVVFNKVNTGPFATCCGIDDVCKIMSDERSKTIDRVYQLARLLYENIYGSKDDYEGIPNSYELMVNFLNNTAHAKEDYDQPSARSWLYQQCYEYGQFVTTDDGKGLFSNTVPLDYWIGLCADVFEPKIISYTIDNLNTAVKRTGVALGLDRPFPFDISETYKGSNALIYNGEHDPWILVGLKNASDKTSNVINIAGVGHASVLQPYHKNDPKELSSARNILTSTVKQWIKAGGSARKIEKEIERGVNKAKMHVPDELKKEEVNNVVFKEIHNWISKIYYSANGKPSTGSPSFKAHIHNKKAGSKQKKFASARRGVSMVQQLKRKAQKKALKEEQNKRNHTSIKKRYSVTGYIRQDVDHFDSSLKLQFDQRFFKNNIAQEDEDAVRFLMIGAEAPIDWTYVDDDFLQYYLWAKDFHAVMYSLEHRFFGYSSPFENTTVEVLSKYLTTEQVLADLAVFVQNTNERENNTINPRWVVFGGSYGGNLVALFRLRYPKLSVGGVASSAAMQPKTDFYEYMQKVERDIKRYGPVNCPSEIRIYFAWVRLNLGSRQGRRTIKRELCLNNKWDENYIDEKDAELLLADLVFGLDAAIQYDDEVHYRLKYLCYKYQRFNEDHKAKQTTRHKKALELENAIQSIKNKLSKQLSHIPVNRILKNENPVRKFLTNIRPDDRDDYYEGDYNYSDYDDSIPSRYSDSQSRNLELACYPYYPCYGYCSHVSYTEMLENLRDVYRECFQGSDCTDESRLWFWITCSQWGFAESTNYGYNYFQSALPINHVLDICADVFGDDYNRTRVDKGVDTTYKMYGGKDYYNGSRIIFVHGSEDPWSTLGVTNPLSKAAHSYVINGTSHCEDIYREYEHDVQELKDVRKLIKKQIVRWVRRRKPTAD